MDPLPPAKFQTRPWRYNRKRRRSGNEGAEAEGDGKMVKKDNSEGSNAVPATAAAAPPAAKVEKMETEAAK